ncbi:hypothetical protein HHK36_002273 [Tetracentron sinense]|uniref:tRNA (guanine(9)-N(1))-methyltransferase n=1 Tax=Tetracentron sinense TaxID=13715 RepID=A0A835DVV2_TETSI|nr:hypothetical protein HHK36_002273 [Tetracentron sinense]
MMETIQKNDQNPTNDSTSPPPPPTLSKNAQKKLLKQQKFEARKAEKKAAIKVQKLKEAERKRSEWEKMLASVSEEERLKLIESRRELRKGRMEQRSEERGKKFERLMKAKEEGQKIVIDLDFSDLMTPNEIHSLVQQVRFVCPNFCFHDFISLYCHILANWRKDLAIDNLPSGLANSRTQLQLQLMTASPKKICTDGKVEVPKQFEELNGIGAMRPLQEGVSLVIVIGPRLEDNTSPTSQFDIMYCYAVNGRSILPGHLWLTGCRGELETQLQRLPGFDKWIIEKECRSYIEALQDQKENLVYLTADAETVLDELDMKKIYIIGGLVDRNRWKGITMKKAKDQGIQTAKLPIGNYLKMSSSQVLTVNQVVEILLKFLEIRDWKTSFFQVIPQRKRYEADAEEDRDEDEEDDHFERKKKCIDDPSHCEESVLT